MTEEDEFDESLPKPVRSILGAYRSVLYQEMFFLRDNGGRRYKATNGKLIGKSGEGFAYSFDLEAELFLSEDSPVTVTAGSESAKGKVLACEDFEVILILALNLGTKVPSAFISVEPWKLLDSMNERLLALNPKKNPIAVKLLHDGPRLSTKRPIEEVDTGQEAAKAHAENDPVTVIWGPPGTGKTHTMAEIAIDCISKGKSVLVVSHSNISVDGVVSKVAELMRAAGMEKELAAGKVMRFGHVRDEALALDDEVVAYNYALRRDPKLARKFESLLKEKDEIIRSGSSHSQRRVKLEEEIKSIRKSIADEEKRCVERARLVATTVSRVYANKLFEGKQYDMVMFDEVSMAYVPQVVCAAMHARSRLVLVGDFRQLPPIAQGPKSKGALSRDIFWYLKICDDSQCAYYHPWLVMLNEQRRMHPSIAAFSSEAFYGGMLLNHPSTEHSRDEIVDSVPYPGEPMLLVDLSGTFCAAGKNSDNSRFNVLSAVVSLAMALDAEDDSGCGVAVIAPYAAQVRLIRAMLQDFRARKLQTDVSCATVHQFQGSERDVVIIDAVESFPAKRLGILTSNNENGSLDRLVNVAATRARGKLVTVASGRFWDIQTRESKNAFGKLIAHHRAEDMVASAGSGDLAEVLGEMYTGPNITVILDAEDAMSRFLHDINRAVHKIAISMPDGRLVDPFQERTLASLREAKARGVDIVMKCRNWKDLPKDWKGLGWQSDDADSPLVIIDEGTAWYGMPLSQGRFVSSKGEGAAVVLQSPMRIKGKCTIEMLSSLADMQSRMVDGRKHSLQQRSGVSAGDKDGKSQGGLSLYMRKNMKCKRCGGPMKLERGFKSGKFYAKCTVKACGETELVDKGFVNHYLCVRQARCPKCKSHLEARISKFGIYIQCDRGHTIKLDEV